MSINATKPIQIPDKAGEPVQTTTVEAGFNLPSSTKTLMDVNASKFDPTDSTTYSSSTSVVVYDSLGPTPSPSTSPRKRIRPIRPRRRCRLPGACASM